jgi:hypothetical protein
MSWIELHMVVLDIGTHLVHLNSPVYGKVTLHLPVISHIKASLHHVVEKRLQEMHMVREFPDVFPDDLLGMPLDRTIELQPRAAPIAKSLYRMTLVNLAEFKM